MREKVFDIIINTSKIVLTSEDHDTVILYEDFNRLADDIVELLDAPAVSIQNSDTLKDFDNWAKENANDYKRIAYWIAEWRYQKGL